MGSGNGQGAVNDLGRGCVTVCTFVQAGGASLQASPLWPPPLLPDLTDLLVVQLICLHQGWLSAQGILHGKAPVDAEWRLHRGAKAQWFKRGPSSCASI